MPDPLRAEIGQRARAHSAGGLNVSHRPRLRTPSPSNGQHGGHDFQHNHVIQQHQVTAPDWQFGNFLAPPGSGQQQGQHEQNELLGMGMYLGGGSSSGSEPSTAAFDFNSWYPATTAGFDFGLLSRSQNMFEDSNPVFMVPQHDPHTPIHTPQPLPSQDQEVTMAIDQPMFQQMDVDLPSEELWARCWRCMVYHLECDNSTPCRHCQKDASDAPWLEVGCRRGPLTQHTSTIAICPNSDADHAAVDLAGPTGRTATQLLGASSAVIRDSWERLLGVLSDPRDPPHKIMLEMLCQPGELARLRLSIQTDPPLRGTVEQDFGNTEAGMATTNTVGVVWELLDNPTAKQMLGIQSVEMFTEALKAAVIFESEYGQSMLVTSAIASMRACLDALRIRSAGNGLLTGEAHAGCSKDNCKLPCFSRLRQSNDLFLDELSRLVFKEGSNLQGDRRWWLSWLYSLWIRAYVRRALLAIERHLQPPVKVGRGIQNPPSRPSFTHSHLVVRAFRAASAGYDPLIMPWTVEELPGILETASRNDLRFLKYLRYAQKAFRTEMWQELGIFSTFDYLDQLFEVGGADTLPSRDISTAEKRKNPSSSNASTKRRASSIKKPNSIPPSPVYSHSSGGAHFMPHVGSSESPRKLHSRSPSIDGASGSTIHTLYPRESSADSLGGIGVSLTGQWHAPSPTQSLESEDGPNTVKLGDPHLPAVPTLTSSSRNKKPRQNEGPMPRKGAAGRQRNGFVCGCCPKKPKTFATAEELRVHEAEKNFECPTCHNRFKNKNEAERHRNTLHVRRYSWSCSILCEAAAAFYPDNSTGCDVCGYCGIRFKWKNPGSRKATMGGKEQQSGKRKRSRLIWGDEIVVEGGGSLADLEQGAGTSKSGIPNDYDRNDDNDHIDSTDDGTADGEGEDDEDFMMAKGGEQGGGLLEVDDHDGLAERIEHILTVHRFGKCNSGKKFYRADHFRQHLKHSHGSIPGKWTNILEDACRVHEATGIQGRVPKADA